MITEKINCSFTDKFYMIIDVNCAKKYKKIKTACIVKK